MTIDVGVLTVVVVLLAAMVARRASILVRDWVGRRWWAAAVLIIWVVLLGVAVSFEARHQLVQARATALVRLVSGVPLSAASCQRFTPDLLDLSFYSGFVSYDNQHVAKLRRTVCNDLAGWMLSDKTDPTVGQIRAVHVTVHEAIHVGGQFDEAVTECTAMQKDTDAAMFFGATRTQAVRLTQVYYQGTYPDMDSSYRSASCAEGQPFDLTPGDGQFP